MTCQHKNYHTPHGNTGCQEMICLDCGKSFGTVCYGQMAVNNRPDTPRPVRGVENPTIRYCLGFLFNEKRNHVLLMEKKRPEWQRGKLNGIGGKLLTDELPYQAMRREFLEETGVEGLEFKEICILQHKLLRPHPEITVISKVWVFAAYSDEIWNCTTQTDEILRQVSIKGLPSRCIPNLHWLIPMCLDKELQSGEYAVRSMTRIFESEY